MSEGLAQTAMPFAPPPSSLPPQVLPAWVPVTFKGHGRRLCQVCGWTTQEKNIDNKAHALAHLRAEILALRLREDRIPTWGFIEAYLLGLTSDRLQDDGGRATLAQLNRFWGTSCNFLRMPTITTLTHVHDLHLPSTLMWIGRDTALDLLRFLPDTKGPATRRHLLRMLGLARLVLDVGVPIWVAASALNLLHTSTTPPPKTPVAPSWMCGQWGVEKSPLVREMIEEARVTLESYG